MDKVTRLSDVKPACCPVTQHKVDGLPFLTGLMVGTMLNPRVKLIDTVQNTHLKKPEEDLIQLKALIQIRQVKNAIYASPNQVVHYFPFILS